MNDLEAARTDLEHLLEIDPGDLEALCAAVEVNAGLGRLDEAARFLELALRLAPDLPHLRLNMANLQLQLGNPARAAAELEHARRSVAAGHPLTPGGAARILRTQVDLALHAGRLEEARRGLEELGKIDPPLPTPEFEALRARVEAALEAAAPVPR